MRGVDQRHAFGVQLLDHLEYVVARLRIYTHGGFIHQNQLGLMNQTSRHVEATLHASRKVLDKFAGAVSQSCPAETALNRLLKCRAAHPVIAAKRLEIFATREPWIQRQFLRNPS